MKEDISTYQFIAQLKALHFIDEIWLFGSRARGDDEKRADIDLAILCPKATDTDWLQVIDIINEADTLLKIDCIRFEKDQMSDELWKNILNDKEVIYVKTAN